MKETVIIMLQVIDWRITYQCDNKCLYCYGNKPIKRLSLAEEEALVDKIVDSECRIVNITGGEPLLERERCFGVIYRLVEGGKSVYLSTNGTNLAGHLDFIRENVALLGLPLDGYDELSNQVNGRAANSFSVIKNILDENQERKDKVNIKIGTVITKKNLSFEHLMNMCNFLKDYDICIWRIYEMIPVNRGEINRGELEINSAEREKLYEMVEKIRKYATNIKIELVTRSMRNSAYFIIQPNGSVIIPTDSVLQAEEIEVGNLVNEPINSVYEKWSRLAETDYCSEYMQTRKEDVSNRT